jgi:agmatine deiminase
MRSRTLVPILSVLPALLACELADPPAVVPAGTGGAAKAKFLPAWQLPSEARRMPGKADQYADFRLLHPEWYAVTVPPQGEDFHALVEWEETQALLLAFPDSAYPESIARSIADIAVATVPYAKVVVVSKSLAARNVLVGHMKEGGLTQDTIDAQVSFLDFDGDSIWMIDFGPYPLVAADDTLAFADFRYYHERTFDDAIPARLAGLWGVTDYRPQMYFEGGNFITDGEGRCYMTQGGYWENPDATEAEVEQVMKDFLGCKKIIVLKPLDGEGTTHIDMFSKLVAPDRFVLGRYGTDADAVNAKVLDDDRDILSAVDLGEGKTMQIFRIAMPSNAGDGDKVWRTYTNSTFVKPVNIWPTYTDWQDTQKAAANTWKTAMPDWKHVGVLSDEIITWGGAMHCVSRNIPAGKLEKWIADGTCGGNGLCAGPAGGDDGRCETDADCSGAALVCECNDCKATCKPSASACEGIGFEGCCMPDGTLRYCDRQALRTLACGSVDACGWDDGSAAYACGFAAEGPASFPRLCPGVSLCGDVTAAGTCEGDVLKACDGANVVATDCAAEGLVCGDDPARAGAKACVAAPCADDCEEGFKGCSVASDGTQRKVVCVAFDDGCLHRQVVACAAGETCADGECVPAVAPEETVEDVPAAGDDATPAVETTTSKGGSSGCAAGAVPATGAWFLPGIALTLLAFRRRRP